MNGFRDKYSFAFTGASMKFHDFIRLASFVKENKIDVNKEIPDANIIMGRSNSRTNIREFTCKKQVKTRSRWLKEIEMENS